MPDARIFIDSTSFLYTIDRAETEKGRIALSWLVALRTADRGVTNLQVLNEIASVATWKSPRFGDDPFGGIDTFAMFGSEPVTLQTVIEARLVFSRYRYSWWDCLLLASAIELGCTHFLSEDLQDGQRIEIGSQALTIVDPFAHTPDQVVSG